GHVTNAQLRRALDAQPAEWQRQDWRMDPEARLRPRVAGQRSTGGAMVVSSDQESAPEYSLQWCSRCSIENVPNGSCSICRCQPKFHLAFSGNIEYQALLAIEQILRCQTEACLTTTAEVDSALERIEQREELREKTFAGPRTPEELARIPP